MVLQLGGDDHVAGTDSMLEAAVAERVGDQVDPLGGVLGEHQLIGIGADERGDLGAALLVGVGGLLHQLVRAAVHRAVGGDEKVAFGVEHLQRALRRGPGIEVGQLVSATHHALQDREVRPDLGEIQRLGRRGHVRLRPPE